MSDPSGQHNWSVAIMPGNGSILRAALAVEYACRHSGVPELTRSMYWMWNKAWDTYLAVRRTVRDDVAKVLLNGIPVRLDLRDRSVTRVLYLFHEYEERETLALSRLLDPGMTFIDLGANIGYYTIIAALAVGRSGEVIAFEPGPDNLQYLRRNVELNALANVLIEPLAISSGEEEAILFLSSINSGDHRTYDGKDDVLHNAGRRRSSVVVPATSLDRYLAGKHRCVDLIKMDIQGAEYFALQGMRNTLESNRDVVLMAEYWPYGLARSGASAKDFLQCLRSMEFEAYIPIEGGGLRLVRPEDLCTEVDGDLHVTLFWSRRDL